MTVLECSNTAIAEERDSLHQQINVKQETMDSCMKSLTNELESSETERGNLQDSLNKLSTAYDTARDDFLKNQVKLAQLQKKKKEPKSLKQKIARREDKILDLEQEKKILSDKVEHFEEKLELFDTTIKSLVNERRALMLRVNHVKKKLKDAERKEIVIESSLSEEMHLLEDKLKSLETENRELSDLGAVLNSPEIIAFQNGRYTDDIRETIMELLQQNVAMRNVGPIIQTVIQNMTGKCLNKIPSKDAACQILKEANFVAKTHVAKEMLSGNESHLTGNCLSSDGTTKFHKKYQSFQITTLGGRQLSIGMKELAGGDAAEALLSFQHTMQDIADTLKEGKENISHLITSLKNTMSDKCSVNHVFNAQLKALRAELLPAVVEQWDELSDATKSNLKDMGNYFCRMHILVNMALESDKVLKDLEEIDGLQEAKFALPLAGESGAARLVRTAVKALHPRGCEQSGAAADFQAYLQDKERVLMLTTNKGNRFNILFYNSAALYYHLEDIAGFLKSLPSRNRLLNAVLEDLGSESYKAGVRALGLLDKFVTGPYWRKLNKARNILDLNEPLLQLKEKLEGLAQDSSPLIDGSFKLYADIDSHVDLLYDALLRPDLTDATTQIYLEAVMHGLLLILERQAEEQLPGGCHYEPSRELLKSADNVPTTNIVSERDFGSLDMLLRMKPAASTLGLESLIMWSNNKTADWVRQLSEIERSETFERARRDKRLENRFKNRKAEVLRARAELLKAKQNTKVEKEGKQYRKRVECAKSLEGKSIWMKLEDMERSVAGKSEQETVQDIIKQLHYHQHVFKSKGDRSLFAKSSKGKALSSDALRTNMATVLQLNSITDLSSETEIEADPSNDIMTAKYDLLKNKLMERRRKDREGRKITKEKAKLERYKHSPISMVGKRIHHQCKDDDGDVEWFAAVVRDMVEEREDTMKIEYNIIYDDYQDEVWTFPLLRDLKNGDLIISE